MAAPQKPELVRGLNLYHTVALVIGNIIGTGVFLKTATMGQAVGSPGLILLVWVAAGLLSLAGALTYAELGAMFPKVGGEFVFLRKAYGNIPAFLLGWTRIVIASSGSIASFGVVFAGFLSDIVPAVSTVWCHPSFKVLGKTFSWEFGAKQLVAIGIIWTFSLVNCARVIFGARILSLLTYAKVLGIAAIIIGVFFFSNGASWENLKTPVGSSNWCGWSAFATAMIAALWAFDGWNNMPMVASEVKNPSRNIPRGLFIGMFVVLLVYGLVNLAYCYSLPFSEIVTSKSTDYNNALPVATKSVQTFLGKSGVTIITVAFIISVIGVLNGSILTNARVPYAMAKDGLFFPIFGKLNSNTLVPVASILLQAAWASVFALLGSFDEITDSVVFAVWIFYAATTASVFVFRRKMPEAERPYKTFGYPVVPILFVIVAISLLINEVYSHPLRCSIGLGLILLGLPVYFYCKKRYSPQSVE